jgi:quercetin dioxygenase-like cupin family protein
MHGCFPVGGGLWITRRYSMAYTGIARFVQSPAAHGTRILVITDVVLLRASAVDTGDAYSLFEIETPPAGGFPPHSQRHDDKGFFVIEGRYTMLVGEREIALGAGDFVLVPRGTVHGYINSGSTTARMLVMATPGGIQETFFDEIGDSDDRPAWEPDMARVLAVAPKYGIDFPSAGAQSTQS